MNLKIILDSSVFIKTFLDEDESDNAISFFAHIKSYDAKFLVPSIFSYEVMAVALGRKADIKEVRERYDLLGEGGLAIYSLNENLLEVALYIASTGHSKSGFPSFYDAAYHALAIETKGTFLTSDRRHFTKTKDFGHICLLENWRSIFD